MVHGNCVFIGKWLTHPELKPWIQRDKDQHRAFCKFCNRSVDVSTKGHSALKSYMTGTKHNTVGTQNRSLNMDNYVERETLSSATSTSSQEQLFTVTPSAITSSSVLASGDTNHESASQSTFVSRTETLIAEIWWTLKTVNNNISFSSNEDKSFVLLCGENKNMYIACFGIAPHFKHLLQQKVKNDIAYSLLYDESLNHEVGKKQMGWKYCCNTGMEVLLQQDTLILSFLTMPLQMTW